LKLGFSTAERFRFLRNWWQFFTLKFTPVICYECYEICFCAVTGVIFYRIAAITYKICTPKIHRRVEETLTDLTRHILMCKVTKCLYKKLFYQDTNPTQVTVSACGFQTQVRSAWHRCEGFHGVMMSWCDCCFCTYYYVALFTSWSLFLYNTFY
jgi:hypothetical protein